MGQGLFWEWFIGRRQKDPFRVPIFLLPDKIQLGIQVHDKAILASAQLGDEI